MDCEQIADLLSSYLDDDLSREETRLVEKHLESCADCRELMEYLRRAQAAMRSLPEIEVPADLLQRLNAIPSCKSRFRSSLDWLMRPSLQPALGAAAIFLTLFSIYAFNPNRDHIQKTLDVGFHKSISRVERIWARAESLTQALAGYTDDILVSLKNLVGENQD
jgi:predicted anti-sigma-YlaC factor YlaD